VFAPSQNAHFSMHRLLGILLLIGGLLVLAPEVRGQASPQFGVAFGLNVATVDGAGDLGTRQMVSGGAVVRLGLVGPIGVESQLLLSQKGTTVEGGGGSIRYGVGYLNLPVLLRIEGPSFGGVDLYGVGGGFGAVKIFEQERGGGEFSFPLNAEATFFRRVDAGPTAGIGGTIPLGGERRLNLGLRYEHGVVDVAESIDEQPYDQAPFPASAETRTWSLMLRLGI
jgi:hypothetical protein